MCVLLIDIAAIYLRPLWRLLQFHFQFHFHFAVYSFSDSATAAHSARNRRRVMSECVCVCVCLSGPVACCNNSWKIITRATTIAAAMRRLIQNSEIVFKVFARLLLLFFKYNLFSSDFCLLFLHISFIVFYAHFVVTLRIRRFNAACSWCCLRAVFFAENWILLFT